MRYNPDADNSGQVPQEGDYVAYNFSGQIAAGFITRITKSGKIHINQVLPREGHQSIVKGGSRCVLVLESNEKGN